MIEDELKNEEYKNTKEILRYFIGSLILMILSNRLLYNGASPFLVDRTLLNLSLPADELFPLLPWTMLFYFGCFFWWVYIYWLFSKRGGAAADRFFGANILGKLFCFAIYIILPTTIDRPTAEVKDFFSWQLAFLYAVDKPIKLFPSLHCFLGWICFVCIRGDRSVPFGTRLLSFVMAVLVSISTLTTKQHVLVDLLGGALLAELCWAISRIPAVGQAYHRLIGWLLGLFPRKTE